MRLFALLLLAVSMTTPVCANSFTLYLTRHFEKQHGADPQLTERGVQRAHSLALLLADASIEVLYSTDYQRTQQSIAPIADALQMPVESYNPRQLEQFAANLLAQQRTAVIAGHSNTTPALLKLLGGPEVEINEDQYGDLYILSVTAETTTYTKQVVVPVAH